LGTPYYWYGGTVTWLQDVVFTAGTSITQGVITVSTTLTVTGDADFTSALSCNVTDSTFAIKDNATPTKILRFQCSSLSAGTTTITVPDGNDSMVTLTGTQVLTNKTLTSPTINAYTIAGTGTIANGCTLTTPAISGATITGTVTIANGSTITTPVIATPTISDPIITSQKYSTLITYTSDTTLANVTGLTGFTLTAGATYVFEIELKTTMTTNGGMAAAFKLTTATLTALNLNVVQSAAASMVAPVTFTSTTDQAKWIDNKTAAFTTNNIRGTLVVGTGGTVAIQAAQNTSAGGGDATSVLVGSWARFTRVS